MIRAVAVRQWPDAPVVALGDGGAGKNGGGEHGGAGDESIPRHWSSFLCADGAGEARRIPGLFGTPVPAFVPRRASPLCRRSECREAATFLTPFKRMPGPRR